MERELQSCKGSGAEEARGPQQKSYQLTLAGFEGPTQVMPTVSFTELPCGQPSSTMRCKSKHILWCSPSFDVWTRTSWLTSKFVSWNVFPRISCTSCPIPFFTKGKQCDLQHPILSEAFWPRATLNQWSKYHISLKSFLSCQEIQCCQGQLHHYASPSQFLLDGLYSDWCMRFIMRFA